MEFWRTLLGLFVIGILIAVGYQTGNLFIKYIIPYTLKFIGKLIRRVYRIFIHKKCNIVLVFSNPDNDGKTELLYENIRLLLKPNKPLPSIDRNFCLIDVGIEESIEQGQEITSIRLRGKYENADSFNK